MKRLFSTLLVAFAMLGAGAAHAYTDCASGITKVSTDVGTESPHFYALTTAGVGFDIPKTDPSYNIVVSLTEQAMITGTEVVLRFNADGVNCATANDYRTDLIKIFINNGAVRN